MRDIVHVREQSPGSAKPDPGRSRAVRESRFYLGLVALAAVFIGANLAFFAIIPAILPGWVSVGISSGSMSPAIRTGDVVIARAWDASSEIVPGSIITYETADGYITHRVVDIDEDGTLVVKGDANRTEDPPVHPDQVVGVARLVIPYAGLPSSWLNAGRYGYVALFLVLSGTALYFSRYAVDPKHDPWAPPRRPDRAPNRVPVPDRRYGPAGASRVHASKEQP